MTTKPITTPAIGFRAAELRDAYTAAYTAVYVAHTAP